MFGGRTGTIGFGREIPPAGDGDFYILGEAPGQAEDRAGVAFIGSSGNLLFRTLLSRGISRSLCRVANVFWMKPPGNNINAAKKHPNWNYYRNAVLEDIQKRKPKVVLALGAEALRLFTEDISLKSARGYLLKFKDIVVIPTWHPSKVLREDSLMFSFKMDINKAKYVYTYGVDKDFENIPYPTYPNNKEKLIELLDTVAERKSLWSIDIECSQAPWRCNCIGICCEEGAANAYPDGEIVDALKRAVKENGGNAILHNANFDLTWLYGEFGVEWKDAPHDTMVMMHILFCDQPKSLEFCSSIFLNVPMWKFMRLESGQKGMYNIIDCVNTFMLYPILKRELEQLGAWDVYDKQKRKELIPAVFMGYLGLRLDRKRLAERRFEVETKMQELYETLSIVAGEEINLNSHQQLKALLYDKWKLPIQKIKGKVSSGEEAIEKLIMKVKDPVKRDWLETYLKWKHLSSILSKELKIEECVFTGAIHTMYNIAGTEGARWSSSAPLWKGGTNLQNRSPEFRDIYIPRFDDWMFIARDYSGAEAWITAWRCGDEIVKEAFFQNADLHKITASMMFGIRIDEVTKELRNIGKRIRHASNYNMSWRTLMNQMKCSAAEAKELLHRFHSAYPKIKEVFHQKTIEIITRERVLRDAWGFPRVFTGRLDDAAYREAFAFFPQSTCTHTLNKALLEFWEWSKDRKDVALNLQVHDELVVTCKRDKYLAEEVSEKLLEVMSIPIPIEDLSTGDINQLTLKTSLSAGFNWKDLKTNEWDKTEDMLKALF